MLKLLSALFFYGAEKRNEDGAALGLDQKAFLLNDPGTKANGKCAPRCINAGLPDHGELFGR